MHKLTVILVLALACPLLAQEPKTGQAEPAAAPRLAAPSQPSPAAGNYTVPAGTRVPLLLINSISTRSASEGDQVYLETAFPVVINQKIVIPPGSYVKGTITQVKRPGRTKGRGEVYLRFDSLTLPNGVTRDFRGRVAGVDGSVNDKFEKREGKIQGDSAKGADAGTIATAAASGTGIGAIAGSAAGRPGLGTAVGAAGGAAAGLAAVLFTRGPEVQLLRGTELDMVLDRSLEFSEEEVRFDGPAWRSSVGSAPVASRDRNDRGRSFPSPYGLPRPW